MISSADSAFCNLKNKSSTPAGDWALDVTAGWTMNASLSIYDYNDWCSIPYDDYDFENGNPPASNCGDLTTQYEVYVNGQLEDTFTQSTTENNTININL